MAARTSGDRRRDRILITIDPDVRALLDRTGNRSAYIEQAVRERWRAWQEALSLLRAQGWHREELHAACDALNGHWMIPYEDRVPMGSSIALELYDAARLNGVAEKHQVAPRVWEARVEQVRTDDRIARALRVVVTEWWSGNQACETAVARAGKE